MSRLVSSDCLCEACRARRVAYWWVKEDRRLRRSRSGVVPTRRGSKNTDFFQKVKSLFNLCS